MARMARIPRIPRFARIVAGATTLAATVAMLTLSTVPNSAYAARRGGGPIPASTVTKVITDSLGTHVTYASGVVVTDGSQINHLPTPTVTGKNSADWLAFVANGYKPVVTSAYAMVQSTSGIITEVTPPVTLPNCYQPPSGFDLSTANATNLAKYGFPVKPKGMTAAQYVSNVSSG